MHNSWERPWTFFEKFPGVCPVPRDCLSLFPGICQEFSRNFPSFCRECPVKSVGNSGGTPQNLSVHVPGTHARTLGRLIGFLWETLQFCSGQAWSVLKSPVRHWGKPLGDFCKNSPGVWPIPRDCLCLFLGISRGVSGNFPGVYREFIGNSL